MSHLLRLTDASFEAQVLDADRPVLVEFWASWCPPCKMMEPTLAELAIEYDGKLKVCKMNTDQNPRTTLYYTVQGVPTFILFEKGKPRGRRTGAQSKGQLLSLLNQVFDLETGKAS
jgi:thioredoxin 1